MPGGRPTKLTPQIQRVILNAVRAAVPMNKAAALAGVDVSTIFGWKKLGKKQKSGIYFEFFTALKKAESEFIRKALNQIQTIARTEKQWTALAWILERRFPEEFGNQRHVIADLEKKVKALEEITGGSSQPQAASATATPAG